MANKIFLKKENEELEEITEYPNLKIEFLGDNSKVIIEEGSIFYNASFKLYKNNTIEINKTHRRGLRNFVIDMSGSFDAKVFIDKNTSCESCRLAMANEKNPEIFIGKDNLISSNVTFRATDGHIIYDITSKKILNKTKPIIIGSHVWIGSGATILKGTIIGNNCIIATQSVVANIFEKDHIIVGGNPAKIIKDNINWDRTYPKDKHNLND